MKILIAIHGSRSQPEQMQAQRETWLAFVNGFPDGIEYGLDYKFFLGSPKGEAGDVVYLDMPDGPNWADAKRMHRTPVCQRKTEALCRYAYENAYDYVFKCDDDTYVRVDLLLASGFQEHDYSGFTESHYAFGFGHYRWCQGGAGYWLARRAMKVVIENGLHLVPAEDFAMGQILARNGIHPQHDERYNATNEPKSEDWITLHKIGPELMRKIRSNQKALQESIIFPPVSILGTSAYMATHSPDCSGIVPANVLPAVIE